MGLTEDRTLVVPLILDHAVWSRPASEFATAVQADVAEHEAARARLLVSGSLSERARGEFEARGIEVLEQAFEALRPAQVAERRP
ncbi:MAG: hypothetical protein HKP30_13040 [Myxococcales bacterium]|nr:hypothetical protein [Myxococcales bacterium]